MIDGRMKELGFDDSSVHKAIGIGFVTEMTTRLDSLCNCPILYLGEHARYQGLSIHGVEKIDRLLAVER